MDGIPRARRARKERQVAVKAVVVIVFVILLLCLYVLSMASPRVDVPRSEQSVVLPSEFSRGNYSIGQNGRHSDLRVPVLLLAEGPVEIRTDENRSGIAEIILTVDLEDLQDIADDYRHGYTSLHPPVPMETSFLLHNPNLCTEVKRLDWIVYVHSAIFNADRRQLLRETWANKKLFKEFQFRVIFLIGRTNSDEDQEMIKEEFALHKDIVQGNFDDDYKNLTLKAVMGLQWISTYCPQARYGLKADDDTFMNIFAMAAEMSKYVNQSSAIICPVWGEKSMPILRDRKNCLKWCVRKRDLPGQTHFPQYCAGIGYAMSGSLIGSLYRASRTTPFFWIDDVYVTGLLVKKVKEKVKFVNIMNRFTLKEDLAIKQYENMTQPITYYFVHTRHRYTYLTLWNQLLSRLDGEQRTMLSDEPKHFKVLS